MSAALLAAALVLGYLAGRLQPWGRLDTWVWRRMTFGGAWTRSKPRQVIVLSIHAVVRPVATVRIWRHRNDPPPPRSPAVQLPGPPPNGLPCFGPTGDWLCVRPSDDGHSDHFPYRPGPTEDAP